MSSQSSKRSKNVVELRCLICGKQFNVIVAREFTAKFCSRPCAGQARRSASAYNWAGDNIIRTCVGCKKQFTVRPKHHDQQYCSRTCVDKFVRKGERKSRIEQRCLYCNAQIRSINSHPYCDRQCLNQHKRQMRMMLICQNLKCKKEFWVQPCFSAQKFCSVSCKYMCMPKRAQYTQLQCANTTCSNVFTISVMSKNHKKFCSPRCFLHTLHAGTTHGLRWYSYQKKSGDQIRVQGGYELALAEYWDQHDINFQTHKDWFVYIDEQSVKHRYYPDFVRTIDGATTYYDTKNSYLLRKTQHKIVLVRQQNPSLNLIILDEQDLTNMGVNLPRTQEQRLVLCTKS